MQGDWCHRRAYSPNGAILANRIHGGDGDEARLGKWLHIQPQGAEVMRVPYRRQRNTVLRRAFHQEGSGRGKRGLREAVAGVHAKTASHRVDDGFRMAVDIPALSESTYPGTRKRPWLRRRRGRHGRPCRPECATVADVPFSRRSRPAASSKSSNAMVLLSVSLPGFAVIRYPRLRCLVDAVLRSSSNARRFRPFAHHCMPIQGWMDIGQACKALFLSTDTVMSNVSLISESNSPPLASR